MRLILSPRLRKTKQKTLTPKWWLRSKSAQDAVTSPLIWAHLCRHFHYARACDGQRCRRRPSREVHCAAVKGGSFSPFGELFKKNAIRHRKCTSRQAGIMAPIGPTGQKVCGRQNRPLGKDKGAPGPRDWRPNIPIARPASQRAAHLCPLQEAALCSRRKALRGPAERRFSCAAGSGRLLCEMRGVLLLQVSAFLLAGTKDQKGERRDSRRLLVQSRGVLIPVSQVAAWTRAEKKNVQIVFYFICSK